MDSLLVFPAMFSISRERWFCVVVWGMGREHGIEAYRGNDAISRSSLSSGAILGEGVGKRAGLGYLLTFYLMYILVEFESFIVSVAMFLIVCHSFVRSFVRSLACTFTLCTTACPYAPLCCRDRNPGRFDT
jgi:pheromone shutdown protein TraB